MISDVLSEAIHEIDRYLEWDNYKDPVTGQPYADLVELRNHMARVRVDLDIPSGFLSEKELRKAQDAACIPVPGKVSDEKEEGRFTKEEMDRLRKHLVGRAVLDLRWDCYAWDILLDNGNVLYVYDRGAQIFQGQETLEEIGFEE